MRKMLIGMAAFALGMSGQSLAQESGWRVSESSGDVRVVVNGQTQRVTRGMLLASGSTIASGARARAVLVHGRDYVILSPSSRIRLPGGVQRTAASGPVSFLTQVVSEAGTALYRIERRANPHFRVQTPYLAAVVKGTVFSVSVNGSGASVQVTEGAVEVSTVDGGAAELVRPGMVATVEAGDLLELNIQGEVSRTVRSGGRPLPGVATVPVADAGRYDGPQDAVVEVTAPVREEPVSLSEVTDGLVSGQPGIELALADVREERRPPVGTPAPLPVDTAGPPTETPPPPVDNPAPPTDTGAPPPPGDGQPAPGADNGDHGTPDDNDGAGDGNNGHGNDDDGDDASNPGNGGGSDTGGPGNNNGGGNDDAGDGDGGDGDNGHGNDDDGDDASNPGNSGGNDNGGPSNGNGGGNDDADDGNNGHGNDDDGDDSSNPGNGNGGGNGNGRGNGGGLTVCLPADLACVGLGGGPRNYYSLVAFFDSETEIFRRPR